MDEHTLNDLLECSVCLERLDTSSKVLPCQHTFCRKCLEVIYASRQELRCPECRVLVDTKIDELPPNVLLMRILEGMKNAATKQHNQSNTEANENSETNRFSNTSIPSGQVNDESSRQPQQQQRQQQQAKYRQTNIAQQHHHYQQQTQLPSIAQIPPQQQQPPLSTSQQRRCLVPHAYALYDFDSSEPSDLKFKKGDLILLRRKIDSNWYVGQFKGVEGNFPINYVQVVVPLPTSQCVALYDFKMGPNEEEGCLTFKKGTVIQVLRRVDQNWAEGRIGVSIGIFPIAFVELNHMAKQLLESYVAPTSLNNVGVQQASPLVTTQTNEIRNLPPIPVIDSSAASTSDSSTSTSSATPITSTTANAQLSCSSSSNSSATTSPTCITTNPCASSSTTASSSSSNAIFHSMPNSPQSSLPTTPQHTGHIANASSSVRLRNNDLKHKRHSLNALLNSGTTALSIVQTNRHSAEILSVPHDFEPESATASSATGQTTAATEQQHHATNLPTINNQLPQSLQNVNQTSSSSAPQSVSTPRHNIIKTSVQQNIPPSLPWGYLALYPYKPRKNDELELKKGCVYMVTERCLDGWFKGKNWKDVCGVFPGNYVTPLRARDQQQLMHSWKLIPPTNYSTITSATHMNNPTAQQQQAQVSSNYSPSMRNDLENINARLTLANLTPHQAIPPDLPPRQLAMSPTTTITNMQQVNLLSRENRDKEALKEKPTTTGCMSTSSSSASTSNSTSSASAGLKKFLTHIKSRSKSPGTAITAAAASTQTNAAAAGATAPINNSPSIQHKHNQAPIGNVNTLTPIHVRSGSCPSQLLQNFPNELSRGSVKENKDTSITPVAASQQPSSPQTGYGSQRIKGCKERPSLENSRPTIDSTLRSIYANHIQQQSALMPKKCGQQYQQPQPAIQTHFNNSTTTVIHRKSHSLDASNILQSSSMNNVIAPSTSSIGSGAVPQYNINAAAVHASATTKSSTQNAMNESRFRCVVPYPPNSDVELELQVGDIIFVYRKQKNGWYKGTNSRTYKTGLFPASFVEPDL